MILNYDINSIILLKIVKKYYTIIKNSIKYYKNNIKFNIFNLYFHHINLIKSICVIFIIFLKLCQ